MSYTFLTTLLKSGKFKGQKMHQDRDWYETRKRRFVQPIKAEFEEKCKFFYL